MPEKTLAQVHAPIIHDVAAYWAGKCRDTTLPSRLDIDPVEMPPKALPWIILTELSADPLGAYFRLVGTGITEKQGNFTGFWANELYSDQWLDKWLDQYRRLMENRRPLFGEEDVIWGETRVSRFEFALFPLSGDGATVDMVLEVEYHYDHLPIPPDGLTDTPGLPYGTMPKPPLCPSTDDSTTDPP